MTQQTGPVPSFFDLGAAEATHLHFHFFHFHFHFHFHFVGPRVCVICRSAGTGMLAMSEMLEPFPKDAEGRTEPGPIRTRDARDAKNLSLACAQRPGQVEPAGRFRTTPGIL